MLIAFSGLLVASPKKVGICFADGQPIDLRKVKFVNEESALIFLDKIEKAIEGKLNYNWDKRGAYILIVEGEKVKAYECRPWMAGDSLCLLPTQFKSINKNTIKFSGYEISDGFKVPKLARKLLISLFPDLKKLEKKIRIK